MNIKNQEQTLSQIERQISLLEKKKEKIKISIQKNKDKDKPKLITDIIKSFNDALKYTNKKESDIYSKTDTKSVKYFKRIMFLVSVMNEGHKVNADGIEYRYYPYFYFSGSGFASVMRVAVIRMRSASASCLSYKSRELAKHAGKYFIDEYENFIKA